MYSVLNTTYCWSPKTHILVFHNQQNVVGQIQQLHTWGTGYALTFICARPCIVVLNTYCEVGSLAATFNSDIKHVTLEVKVIFPNVWSCFSPFVTSGTYVCDVPLRRAFQVRWDNSIPLFLHAAIYLGVSLFRWTSQNAFSRETAVYKWYCVQCCIAALHGRPDHDQ